MKKALSLLLSVLMAFSSLNVLATAYAAKGDKPAAIAKVTDDINMTMEFFSDITEAVNAEKWKEDSTLTIYWDIETTEPIIVPAGRHILDLNGFGIKASGSRDFSIFVVPTGSELILNDSGSDEHRYSLDENNLATVDDDLEGTEGVDYFTFTGGYITGASGSSLSGAAVSNYGTFTMNGGTIIGNSTGTKGGGIYSCDTVNINGGLITYNRANGWGGGIYLSDEGANTVNLSGGAITHNGAGNGGGIHVSRYDTVNLSGSPIVKDNYSINNNPDYELNNINLAQDGIICVTGALGSDASIGVRSSNGASVLTNSANTEYNDASKFTSDNGSYVVGKDASSSQLKIHTPYTVQWLNENNDILETDNDVAEGEIPTYDGEAPTKPNDTQAMYVFDEWSPEVVAATGNASYTATYKETTPVAKVDDTLFGSITNAVKAENWTEGSTLTLLADIDITESVNVPAGAHTVDLNGYGIRAAGSSDFAIIKIPSGASLTMNDSGSTEHRYTVDENGLATVDDSLQGTEGEDYFTFTGGYLTGIRTESKGPSAVEFRGPFTMNGGTIIGNSTNKSGAGLGGDSTLTINGGQIIYNIATNWGGGVYLPTGYYTFNLAGGVIAHNKCGNNGGGIHISENVTLNISGDPVVSENYKGNTLNNVNIANGATVNVVSELEDGASIGVKMSNNTGVFTSSANTEYNDATKFVSDNSIYVVGKDALSSQLKLHTPYTVLWKNYDDEILETDTNVAEGEVPTYDGETPVKPDDEEYTYTFEGWTPDVVAATADAQYTATFTAVPKPKTYTVTWLNYDGAILETDTNVTEGTVPTYDGETPVKPDDAEFSYVFDKWSPDVTAATGDATYVATFTAHQRPVAEVDGVEYYSFSEAAAASGGVKNIVLLRNMEQFSMNNLAPKIGLLRIKANGNEEDVVDYERSESRNNVSYYFRDNSNIYVDGEGSDDDSIEIAAGVAASIVVAGGSAVSFVLGSGSSVVVEGSVSSLSFDVSDPESECLEEQENEDGSKEIKNHKYHWVTIDTGISILDAGSEILPDCVNDIWATYNQNTASIIKILPPVLTIVGYTDVILKFPYPEGWYFPPIPYLPEAMNPGSHFVAFFEGAGYDTYGTPFTGKTITEDLEISGVWVPYEAAVEKPNGDHIDYYLFFEDAASERGDNDNIVRILSAPMFSYTLEKIEDDPAVYEVLKVKRGFYVGDCVDAPPNLPEGYAMRTWTYQDDNDETVTCYTIDGKPTEDAYSLSLDDCIHMNLYLDIRDGENASVTVTHNDPDKQAPVSKTETYSGKELASLRDDEDGRYVIKVLAAPAQMRDDITVEINDGDNSRSFTTSVKNYCDAVIDLYKDSDETKEQQLVSLAKTMLDYGKACSTEFSYNESAFASQDYINTGAVTIDGTIQAEGTTSVLKGYSYIAKSIPSLRIYINKTEAQCVADGLVATVTDANGNVREIPPTVVEGTTKVCLDITGILAENFDGTNVIEYDGATLTINVNQYAKVKGGDFGRSLFNYGVAAHNYFKD